MSLKPFFGDTFMKIIENLDLLDALPRAHAKEVPATHPAESP
jgi:hypothetical protein